MTSRRCSVCGQAILGASPTNTKFCGSACRQRAYRARHGSGIPAELRVRPRWVRHSRSKVPLTPAGKAASSTDPGTWSPYAAVRGFNRKGFVLNGDGIVCLDIDHCLEGGRVLPWAAQVLERVPATYVEVSVSGTGLHVFGMGRVVEGRKKRVPGGTVECYGAGRYIAVTGVKHGSCPSKLGDLSGVLAELLT